MAMSSTCADSVLALNIRLGRLEVFKFLNQSHCTDIISLQDRTGQDTQTDTDFYI